MLLLQRLRGCKDDNNNYSQMCTAASKNSGFISPGSAFDVN